MRFIKHPNHEDVYINLAHIHKVSFSEKDNRIYLTILEVKNGSTQREWSPFVFKDSESYLHYKTGMLKAMNTIDPFKS